MKISALIISDLLNNFPTRTISSLEHSVDEIVLVDTGAGTQDEMAGFVYVKYPNKELDFAEARNMGIAKASGDYIFSIDSDEVLVCNEPFKEIINRNIVDVLYITIRQWHTYLDGYSEFQEYSLPRIFYKTDELEYRNKIHESVSKSLPENFSNYIIPPDRVYLAHTGYDLSVDNMKTKIERNIRYAMQIIDNGEYDAYTYYHLGKLYGVAGEIDLQLNAYNQALRLKGLNEYHIYEIQNYITSYTNVGE